MSTRLAPLAATLSIGGLLAWLFLHQAGEPGDGVHSSEDTPPGIEHQPEGSVAACSIPLGWRLARMDPRFGLTAPEAAGAVADAARLWEDAVGRPLFLEDPAGGFPVRFLYDQRQARTEERRRLVADLESTEVELEADQERLEAVQERYGRSQDRYEARARALEERVARHNAEVRRWNDQGGAPPDVRRELIETERALGAERDELDALEEELDGLYRHVRRGEGRLERRIGEYERDADALEQAFPPMRVESGSYRERVHTEDGVVTSLDREIRIHRFDDRDDLLRVIAHELGHALGLGHADAPGAVMHEEYQREEVTRGTPRVHPADVDLLLERCPELKDEEG